MNEVEIQRRRCKVSRSEFAKYMGVSRQVLWRWEVGRDPTPYWREDQAKYVAKAYEDFLKLVKEYEG